MVSAYGKVINLKSKSKAKHYKIDVGHSKLNAPYPPSTSMFPLSHSGGRSPTNVIEAPNG